ncbi:hypothetical protein C8R43DRAFT_942289 [Mycena crocata]|nr:hypothetical protein C8R43DRAFT_942289 [Mycena crocata]
MVTYGGRAVLQDASVGLNAAERRRRRTGIARVEKQRAGSSFRVGDVHTGKEWTAGLSRSIPEGTNKGQIQGVPEPQKARKICRRRLQSKYGVLARGWMSPWLNIGQDELEEETGDTSTVQRKGATACLVAGMQLEDLQERIKAEKKGRMLLAADLDGWLQELRFSFNVKLKTFRMLQDMHMAPSTTAVEAADEVPPLPEDIKLWMPSELMARQRGRCAWGLGDREARLHKAQASNALDLLRNRLHAKRFLLLHRNSNVVGQRQSTRANTLISQIGERIDALSAKYRRGHASLMVLKGAEYCATHCRKLNPADVALDEEQDQDAKARHRLALIGSERNHHHNAPTFGKGGKSGKSKKKTKTMSWIWTAFGGPDEDEEGMHDCKWFSHSQTAVRVEWSKALARKVRWEEEVRLLREEMRRVLRFLQWLSGQWEGKQRARGNELPVEVHAGVEAHAARQAALFRSIGRRFKTGWDMSVSEIVQTAAQEDAIIGGINILGPEEAPALVGGDEADE